MTDQEITDTQLFAVGADDGTVAVGDDGSARTAVLAEAVTVIDGALAQMMQRELVASGEVADLLLDLRMLLLAAD